MIEKRLFELSLHNPTVMHYLTLYVQGNLALDAAMLEIIAALDEQNKKQFDLLVEIQQTSIVKAVDNG